MKIRMATFPIYFIFFIKSFIEIIVQNIKILNASKFLKIQIGYLPNT